MGRRATNNTQNKWARMPDWMTSKWEKLVLYPMVFCLLTPVNWFKSKAGSQLDTKNPKNRQNFSNGNDFGTKSREKKFFLLKKLVLSRKKSPISLHADKCVHAPRWLRHSLESASANFRRTSIEKSLSKFEFRAQNASKSNGNTLSKFRSANEHMVFKAARNTYESSFSCNWAE